MLYFKISLYMSSLRKIMFCRENATRKTSLYTSSIFYFFFVVFLTVWPCMLNYFNCTQVFVPLWAVPARFPCLWDCPGKNTEWVAISSSRRSSWPRNWTQVSCISCIGRLVLYHWRHLGSPVFFTIFFKCQSSPLLSYASPLPSLWGS